LTPPPTPTLLPYTTLFRSNPANSDITEQALRPNPAFAGDITAGGADEDYDIPDYNNFRLAARVWSTSNNRWEVRSPSFFNPALRSEEHTSELQSRENLVCR